MPIAWVAGVFSLCVGLSVAASPLRALALEPGLAWGSAAEDSAAAYAAGNKALEQQNWSEAVASFDKVINAKSKRADAALYWKAYALNKLGNGSLAQATCYQLRSQYSASAWNKDCSALGINLRVEVQVPPVAALPPLAPIPPLPPVPPVEDYGAGSYGSVPRGSDEDLKILALNSLLNQDPAKAVPLLRGMLSGNQSMRVKKHALFVLAQSKSAEAQTVLNDAVMGKMGPELQRQAIQSVAVFQGKKANDTLAEVYRSTSDAQIKKSVISAFFITQDAPRMVELARNEKDLELKRSIVSQLALMKDKAATDYMLELLK
jgi:hypothetical protein